MEGGYGATGFDQSQINGGEIFDRDFADQNYKIILVGHQRVGKTSIINRYVNDMFNDNEQKSSMMQIMKKLIKIDKTENTWAQLNIWDTLGQEKYKSLSPIFFRKAIGVFLVFDCTSMESFTEIDSWFESMAQTVDQKVLIMMLGNKCDLPHREVPYNLAMEYARRRNFGYLEVSAKTGTNIRNAFNGLVREIYRNMNPDGKNQYLDQKLNNGPLASDLRPKGKYIKLNSQLHQQEDDDEEDYEGDGKVGLSQSDKKGKKSLKKKDKKDKCEKC